MILVTGATGCLGANLTRSLIEAGQPVAALRLPGDRGSALVEVSDQVDWREGDLLDTASLRRALVGVTHVYHAAGLALPFESQRQRMMDVNVQGSENLLLEARVAGVRRLLFVSSIAAVGYPDGSGDESLAYNGDEFRFSYMHSKRASEAIALRFANEGLDVVIVCPAAVIAPYCDRTFGWGRVMLDVLRGKMPCAPPGGVATLSRADLVQGLQRAMEHGRRGERYIILTENVSYRVLVDLFARTVGVRPPSRTAPRWLLRGLAASLQLAGSPAERVAERFGLSPGALELMCRQKHYSAAKAAHELGFRSQQSLQESIAETWEWLRHVH